MGRELQKKKNRSSLHKVHKNAKSKKHVLSNPIIAANWNKHETLTQNYRRLGLTTKLNSVSGGVERTAKSANTGTTTAPLAVNPNAVATIKTREARIERDPETGDLRVIEDGTRRPNPLNDPLNDLEDDDAEDGADEPEWQGISSHDFPPVDPAAAGESEHPVIRQLEEHAASGVRKAPRKQSEREAEWVRRLVEKYGDDYAKMSRDMKLNPMQQSQGDIKRRVTRWRECQKEE